MARLDRFLISTEWNQQFPNSQQKALPNTSSDHCPIIYNATTKFRKTNTFRFENLWLRFQDLDELISGVWEELGIAHTPQQLHQKFLITQKRIKAWAATKVGNIKSQIKTCREYIGWVDKIKELRRPTNLEKFIEELIKKRYSDLVILEEDLWKQ